MVKRHRLEVSGADEQVPRQVRAYGKACGGEFALVLNPPNGDGVLVHVVGKGKKAEGYVWTATNGHDVPLRPSTQIEVAKGVAKITAAKKAVPAATGAAALRGRWGGYVECDEKAPVVVLTRRVASYVTLEIRSLPEGWSAKVIRTGTWFGEPTTKMDTHLRPTLRDAIIIGIEKAYEVVSAACTTRDTTRRAAVDPAYAATHPNRLAPEPRRDSTERLKVPRERRKAGETAPKPAIVTPAPAPTVAAPKGRRKGKAPKAAAEIDAEKDKLLMDHMSHAIRAALEGV